jgi:Fur family ferric uptake transcriptional regulator
MIDINTGTVTEFFDPRIRQIIEDACKDNIFSLSHHSLYIYGEKVK